MASGNEPSVSGAGPPVWNPKSCVELVTGDAFATVSVHAGIHVLVATSSNATVSSGPTAPRYVAVNERVPGVLELVVMKHCPFTSVVHVGSIGGSSVVVPA